MKDDVESPLPRALRSRMSVRRYSSSAATPCEGRTVRSGGSKSTSVVAARAPRRGSRPSRPTCERKHAFYREVDAFERAVRDAIEESALSACSRRRALRTRYGMPAFAALPHALVVRTHLVDRDALATAKWWRHRPRSRSVKTCHTAIATEAL